MSKPTRNRSAHGRLLATASMTALLAAGWTAASAQTTPAPVNDTAVEEVVVCLLYTSPSPRDRQKSRMPSSA